MKKIPTLFVRDSANMSRVTSTVTPGCEWVLAGEGFPTIKHDGTCCLIRGGKLYKRYEVKAGKPVPPNFEPAQEAREDTGGTPGWLPVGDGPEDKWHREAWEQGGNGLPDGTYELMGPKVQGNPEGMSNHVLWRHGCETILNFDKPWDYDSIGVYLHTLYVEGPFHMPIEGIVWHHPDGRMAKIKARDFGLQWPPKGKR